MTPIADDIRADMLAAEDTAALNKRILLVMSISVIIAVAISITIAPWRTTTGLLLGGALSLLNYRWLHSSVGAIFAINRSEGRAQTRSSRYLLRYFVVGVVVFASYQLHLVSLPAAIVGLSSFVPALMFEAARQFYFAIINREESF